MRLRGRPTPHPRFGRPLPKERRGALAIPAFHQRLDQI